MQRDKFYLNHIIESIEKIESYILGASEERFLQNPMMQDAVIRQLEIIGEATKNLDKSTREKQTEIPWADMAKTREFLSHHYFSIDLDVVWQTIKEDLPPLKNLLSILADEDF